MESCILLRENYEQDLKNWYRELLLKSKKQKELSKYDLRKINREVIRVINTSLRIFRYANIEIDEQINSSGEATYSYLIPQSLGYKVKSVLDDIVNKIRRMHDLFVSVHKRESQDSNDDSFDIELEELFLHFEDEGLSFSRIIQIIKLVESSGFFTFHNTIDDWVTVISFETNQNLEPFDITDKSKSRSKRSIERWKKRMSCNN